MKRSIDGILQRMQVGSQARRMLLKRCGRSGRTVPTTRKRLPRG